MTENLTVKMQLQATSIAQNLQANGLKEMVVKNNETNTATNTTSPSNVAAAATNDQETFIPQMPQQPQVKITHL